MKDKVLFESSLDAVLMTSPNGAIQDVNPAACKMFGRTRNEICRLGRDVIMDANDPRLRSALEERENSGKFFGELTGLRGDGSSFPIELSSAIYTDANGEVHTCTVIRDITARKRLETSLLFQQKIVDNIAEGLFLIRVSDQTIVYANPTFERMFGYGPGELPGLNVRLLNATNEKDPAGVAAGIQEQLMRKGSWNGEVKNVKKNGEEFWCWASVSTIEHYEYGQVWIALHADISERKTETMAIENSELRLRELVATKDKFFSIIAHDLKSPFNAIMGFSNLIAEQVRNKDFDGLDEYASVILQSSQRAVDLLNNLMEWSRSQTGHMTFKPEMSDLVVLVNDAIALLKNSALQKSIAISLELPPKLYLTVDRAMINSVLRNLLSNAIKFSNSNGKIVITIEQNRKECLICMKDNGIGIDPVNINKLFRMDQTFSTPGTHKEKGTGLGLLLAKEFIEKHRGKIWLDSLPGKGSNFYFTLPLEV